MLEQILEDANIQKAYRRVVRNASSPGMDGMNMKPFKGYFPIHWAEIKSCILKGTYIPVEMKKIFVPKKNGGNRVISIPTFTDRVILKAIEQWLYPKSIETFSKFSFGFIRNRNAHQAIWQAQRFLNKGYDWIIELDIENFFDNVDWKILFPLLRKNISDVRTLVLIKGYLQSAKGSLPERGVPQGSPLSPLLANILLNVLDRLLKSMRLHYIRYADDCSIYLKNEKDATEILKLITLYIENALKLKVNRFKSRISKPSDCFLLGFSFYPVKNKWQIRISKKTLDRIKRILKLELVSGCHPLSKKKAEKIRLMIIGFVNYFYIADAASRMRELDKILVYKNFLPKHIFFGFTQYYMFKKTRSLKYSPKEVSDYYFQSW